MRRPRLTITNVGWVVVLCLIVLLVIPSVHLLWSFRQLEENAKKRITGNELQVWAMHLLSTQPSGGYVRVSELGTNFPQQLRSLYHQPPIISVHCAETNSPGWVSVFWGGGMIGFSGFQIGPTNFVGSGHRWQDGVYFLDAKNN